MDNYVVHKLLENNSYFVIIKKRQSNNKDIPSIINVYMFEDDIKPIDTFETSFEIEQYKYRGRCQTVGCQTGRRVDVRHQMSDGRRQTLDGQNKIIRNIALPIHQYRLEHCLKPQYKYQVQID